MKLLVNFKHALDHYYNYYNIFSLAGDNYREGSIRLVGGPYNWEGRVEIFLSESWGAISDSLWSDDDANVVCKQLKHSSSDYGKSTVL